MDIKKTFCIPLCHDFLIYLPPMSYIGTLCTPDVYIDQLLGAARTQKLVETLFFQRCQTTKICGNNKIQFIKINTFNLQEKDEQTEKVLK